MLALTELRERSIDEDEFEKEFEEALKATIRLLWEEIASPKRFTSSWL